MGQILPIDRITIIRPEYFLDGQLVGWPCRQTYRETQNAINASFGDENTHCLHGRAVVGAGQDRPEFRGMIIPGKTIADIISQMQDAWLVELVKVNEEPTASGLSQVPKAKIQAKWLGPNTDLIGEPDPERTVQFLNALRAHDLSVRGFWINSCEQCDFVSLVLGPALEAGEAVDWKFYRGNSYLFLEF